MEMISIGFKKYEVVKVVKESDFHFSMICKYKNKQYFVRRFKMIQAYEHCIQDYKAIKKLGIKIPKMIKNSKKNLTILYQFIDAENCAEKLSKEDIPENYFDKLFLLHRFAKFSKVDLNYLPEKFRFFNNEMYYMSYEFFPVGGEKNFEDFGLFHWHYGMDAMNHLKELGLPIDKKRVLTLPELKKKIVLLSIMKW